MAIDGLTILVASMVGLACTLLGSRRPFVVFAALMLMLPFRLVPPCRPSRLWPGCGACLASEWK